MADEAEEAEEAAEVFRFAFVASLEATGSSPARRRFARLPTQWQPRRPEGVDPAACDPGADASASKPSALAAEMPSGIGRPLRSQVRWIFDPFLPRSVRRIRSGHGPL